MHRILLASFLVLPCCSITAQEHAHTIPAAEKLGVVRFETSCNPAVTTKFTRAVALLHSFEFGAAIQGFNDVIAGDSTCAMAYWGIAMSRWGNPMAAGARPAAQLALGRTAVNNARLASAKAQPRESAYVDAVAKLYEDYENVPQSKRASAYADAMEKLSAAYPADTEAKIFYAISVVAAASPADKSYASQMKAGSILEPLWAKEPDHPGLAHYLIHTYDYPQLASRGSAAAREYATIAPSAAHAQHMPSHIFTRTGMWRESIETNKRSMQIAAQTGSLAEVLHASDYAVYAYLQLGRNSDAKAILESLPSIAARFDPTAVTGAAPGSAGVFALAAIPARYALERNDWESAAALVPKPSAFAWTDAMTYFARAIGLARSGSPRAAAGSIDSLGAIRDRLGLHDEKYWSDQVAIQAIEAKAWMDFAEGRTDSALAQMHEAVTREDATEKNAVTPGPLAPAHELLADMLMELKRPADALAEYRKTLVTEPNRRRALVGGIRAAEAAKDRNAAEELRKSLRALNGS